MPTSYKFCNFGGEILGLDHIYFLLGDKKIPQAKGRMVVVGQGRATGCTAETTDDRDITIIVCVDKFQTSYFVTLLNRLGGSESIDPLTRRNAKTISREEESIKKFFGASKVDITYSWQAAFE